MYLNDKMSLIINNHHHEPVAGEAVLRQGNAGNGKSLVFPGCCSLSQPKAYSILVLSKKDDKILQSMNHGV